MYDRSPRSFRAPVITQREARATVKWFNPTKGFGFVTPEDGSADAFLHASALQAAGHDSLPEGATIVCDLSHGPKGPQVATIHSVDLSTATPGGGGRGAPRAGGAGAGFGAPRSGGFDRAPRRSGWGEEESFEGGASVDGTVKWFNAEKGFGFIAPEGGGKDIFVHRTALERSGIDNLADGEQVRVTVRQGQKGPEAQRVEVI
ncbi:MAG TPA: cold shock domain-containing protein [Azospirillaceae bacterium]|nr:cold shock domain-containing protein [Azospirillaceae bacterium]